MPVYERCQKEVTVQNAQKCNPLGVIGFGELSSLSLGTHSLDLLWQLTMPVVRRAFLQIKLCSYADARVVRCRNASTPHLSGPSSRAHDM
jgi:hypothetical protein